MTRLPDEAAPRIYVACLSSYNRGILYGRWIDADQDFEDLRDEVALMLRGSPTEGASEWAIHDHEGFWPLSLAEHERLQDIAAAAKLISEHRHAAALMLDNLGGAAHHEFAQYVLTEQYAGEWTSLDSWVEELLDEGLFGVIPDAVRTYIDVGRIGDDLRFGGDISVFEHDGSVHIFWTHVD